MKKKILPHLHYVTFRTFFPPFPTSVYFLYFKEKKSYLGTQLGRLTSHSFQENMGSRKGITATMTWGRETTDFGTSLDRVPGSLEDQSCRIYNGFLWYSMVSHERGVCFRPSGSVGHTGEEFVRRVRSWYQLQCLKCHRTLYFYVFFVYMDFFVIFIFVRGVCFD